MFYEILALIVSYFGVFAGFWLSKIAREEVIPGKKNLLLFQKAMFLIILIWFFFFTNLDIAFKVIAVVIFMILDFGFKMHYAIIGLAFGVEPSFVLASLNLLYGFPTGSLLFKEKISGILKKTIWYLIFAAIGLAIRNYFLP